MSYVRQILLLFAAVGILQLEALAPSFGAEQAIRRQSDCVRVGGKLRPSGFKASDNLPYVCTYSDTYDRKCQRQLKDPLAYYDIAQKKCTACDMDEDAFCW